MTQGVVRQSMDSDASGASVEVVSPSLVAPEKRGRVDEVLDGARLATRADNALLVELMAHVPMEGTLAVATRRDPDFFALYDLQRGSAHVLAYDDGRVAGMGAALVRDGTLDGVPRRIGYLGDLRVRGAGRARRAFPLAYARFFADVVDETG